MINKISRMEQVVQSYVDDKQFMGSILIAQNGHTLLDKGYGYANLEWQIPNTSTTKFRLGSLTKQFTAASILLLEERGLLKITDSVKHYMPDAPSVWDNITIFNLLTHTSGIPNYTKFPDFSAITTMTKTPEEQLNFFRNKPLNFQPGSNYEYNNSGYVLLGYLIEKISGLSYCEFVMNNIFKPLGMDNSGYDSHSAIILNRASGYEVMPNGLHNADYLDMSLPYSAGSLYSSTRDMLLWEEGLFGEKVLSPTALRKMTTPFKNNYGFGLIIQSIGGLTSIMHAGGINGFNTILIYYPEDQLTVVVLSNLNAIGYTGQDIAIKMVALTHDKTVILPSERKEIFVSYETLTNYVGTYNLTPMNLSYSMPNTTLVISQEES